MKDLHDHLEYSLHEVFPNARNAHLICDLKLGAHILYRVCFRFFSNSLGGLFLLDK